MKISKCTFENYRPKNISLKCDARLLVCCCQYRVNIDYLRKSLKNSLAINEKARKFKNSVEFIDATICDSKNVPCIMGQCKECKDFPKLNDLGIDNFHCSKKCRRILIVLRRKLGFAVWENKIYLLQKKKNVQLVDPRTHTTSIFSPLKRQIAKPSKA